MHELAAADAIVEESSATTDHQLAFVQWLPGKSEARTEVAQGHRVLARKQTVHGLDSGGRSAIVRGEIRGHHIYDQARSGRLWRGRRCNSIHQTRPDVGQIPV